MRDLYLEAMMHGEFPQKKTGDLLRHIKNKFEIAMEKTINDYVDSYVFEESLLPHELVSASLKKVRMKEELMLSTKQFEQDRHIRDAIKFLTSDGINYMDENLFKACSSEFSAIHDLLEQIDLNQEIPENLQKFFNLSNQVVQGIVDTALLKYKEADYQMTLSLFVMLSALIPSNYDFWFRQGISAQMCGQTDLALKAYAKASELNPGDIVPRLFSIECQLEKGLLQEAKSELEELKKLKSNPELSEKISAYLNDLEKSL